ncbi:MAG: hypothetical protein Q8O72_10455 [Bacteroidales bacterium]|nr:hypothetical protein [Bacteroidales bacterium]
MEFYQNTDALVIRADKLWINGIMTKENYKKLRQRKILKSMNTAGGLENHAQIRVDSIPDRFMPKFKSVIGDPKKVVKNDYFTSFIQYDEEASRYFRTFRKPDGKPLDTEKQEEYRTNAEIYTAIINFISNVKGFRKARGGSANGVWQRVVEAVNNIDVTQYPHSLPGNARSIERNLNKFKAGSYIALVHGGVGNINPIKIVGEVADWILATYCLPNKLTVPVLLEMYNSIREANEWPEISDSAINLFLNKPEIKRKWVLARHGKDEYMRLFGHRMKRNHENWFPNAWWGIDGTKLDWVHYYDNDLGMAAKLKIDPVFDVFSEKILGWSFSETENHVDHFIAVKMSVKTAKAKPYLFTYDGQSGHTTSGMQTLYDQLVAIGGQHYKHQAHRHGSPVEGLFNRLQQQVISRFWFSDKQGVKVRDINNAANMDYLLANKERLYTREYLEKAWELAVKKWNEAPHPLFKNKTRDEVYKQEAPISHPVDDLEMVQMFWVYASAGNTYNRDGISTTIAKKQYTFEVYTDDDKVDLEFRRKYIGCKFIVKYDPETLDQFVGLYEKTDNGLLFIAYAKPKRAHEQIPILMSERDVAMAFQDMRISDTEYQRDLKEVEALLARTGITPQKVREDQDLEIKMGGRLTKAHRSRVEADSFLSQL